MRLEPGRFDRVLREIHTGERSCYCPKHLPFRPIALTPPELEAALVTSEWSGVKALQVLNVAYTTTLTSVDPKVAAHLLEHVPLGYSAYRADGNPAFVGGALLNDHLIYLNPAGPFPLRTLAHELAHRELGHGRMVGRRAPQFIMDVMEAQTEAAAILVADALGLDSVLPTARMYVTDHCPAPLPFFLLADAKDAAMRILSAGTVTPL